MTTADRRIGGSADCGSDGGSDIRIAAPAVGRLVADAAARFAHAGYADPRRGSWRLFAAVAGVSSGQAWLEAEASVPGDLAVRFERAVAARLGGVPFAYAAGTASFRTLELEIDRRVLIPRPETEGLVEQVLRWAGSRGRWGVAADVGTGSGCIALSLAVEGRFSRVIATDRSPDALSLARENAARVQTASPVIFLQGDLLEALGTAGVDVLVSNPPYVTAQEWDDLDPGVREWEPRDALVSGTDGLRHIERLLRGGDAVLTPGGLIAMEIDSRRADTTLALAHALGWTDARLEHDLFGRPRYFLATREGA